MPRGGILRDWFKVPTSLRDDPGWLGLSLEERGLFVTAAIFSDAASVVPGKFIARDGSPLPLESLSRLIGCTPAEAERGFPSLAAGGLMAHSKRDGWEITNWLRDFSTEAQRAAVREADAKRQRDHRARSKSERQAGIRERKLIAIDGRRVDREEA